MEQGDVAGHKTNKLGPEDIVPPGSVSVDKKECEPFGFAFYGTFCAPGEAITAVQNTPVLRAYGLTHWSGRIHRQEGLAIVTAAFAVLPGVDLTRSRRTRARTSGKAHTETRLCS